MSTSQQTKEPTIEEVIDKVMLLRYIISLEHRYLTNHDEK